MGLFAALHLQHRCQTAKPSFVSGLAARIARSSAVIPRPVLADLDSKAHELSCDATLTADQRTDQMTRAIQDVAQKCRDDTFHEVEAELEAAALTYIIAER